MSGSHRTGWWALVVERLALPPLLVLSAGLAASAQLVTGNPIRIAGLVVATVGITALLGLLRLMDDLKDLDRDRVAHPDRPLARGALGRRQAERGVALWSVALYLGAAVLSLAANPVAGLMMTVCASWALLMYREFFTARFLERHPLLYAVSHQVIVLPMYGFAAATAYPHAALSPSVAWFAASGLGASFTWEVCRKLDPSADPVLQTYLAHFGPVRTVALAGAGLTLLAVAAVRIQVDALLLPVAAAVAATLPLVVLRPGSFRWVRAAAGLLLLLQPLAPLILEFARSP